jgi:hypothetical protein
MKTKLYGWLIAFFSLVLLHPSGLLAEGAATSVSTPPKTAEELLVVIRDFLANPDTDGVAFVEKITGVSKANWGPVDSKQTGFGQDPKLRWELYVGCRMKQPLLVPYQIFRFKVEEHTQKFLGVNILSHRSVPDSGDPEYLMELTPELTRRVLGQPEVLGVASPGTGFSRDYSLSYHYSNRGYRLWISFWKKGDNDQQIKRERSKYNTVQIQHEQERRRLFENHKDFIAVALELIREK